ncbi:hypothetical protein HMPREF1983_00911 [Gemella bergeri ATCC 700627]|uniref:Uncharacterized protein n=1 Tax=Gemella bergeri ATCC 700627 TaxID=1321820 RepID=U2Q5H5_9BACL|nr:MULTISPECIES: hypothetical protein [Gemella]AME09649.1 hypothetical protein AXE85_05540 [Gemella sp. oral taxon 928]AXI27250.1 hypothetical protein CG018_07465 [Gemella sp. ND 6198]ERK58005.1 hypothetical protein HMPREF1983_00911 [Gemella bergeri ATCC 700627]
MKKEKMYLAFRFTGNNEIGIEEFINFLNNISKYLLSVKKDLGEDFKLSTNVTAIEKGSFIVHIVPVINVLASILPHVIENTGSFIKLVREILEVISFLRGKPPKEITETHITNFYGDQININNPIFQIFSKDSNDTFEAVEKLAEDIPLKRELEVYESVSNSKTIINDENKEYFKRKKITDTDEKFIINTINNLTVVVKKPSLDMSSKWTVHIDRTVNVDIHDKEFAKLVKDGEISFSNGTKLEVDMEIKSYPNNEKIKPTYVITKVHLDKVGAVQQKLDL